MKKIGILNFQYVNDNYGALLQASALAYTLNHLGFNNIEHINFIPEEDAPPPSLSFTQRINRLLSPQFFSILKNKVEKKKVLIRNSIAFENFRQDWITRSSQEYRNFDDLKAIQGHYAAVIVGSDQVWRTKYTGKFALVFFLSFLDERTRRISYAASFGVNHWEKPSIEGLTEQVKAEVEKFHSVSVREKSGVEIVGDVMDVKAFHVLDPTLLVPKSFFEEIMENVTDDVNPDIVFYKLDADEVFFSGIEHISAKLECHAENIYYKTSSSGIRSYTDVDEWLAKIRNSKLIITDSFHCVCFSIIFKKQFICIGNKERGLERLESMLNQLGLLDRLCINFNLEAIKELLDNPIDYNLTERKLEPLIERSTQFLVDSLNEL